jgi:hypothetical protein
MNNTVFLEYTFVFDPSEAWSHLYEFESMISKYLESIGMEGEIIKRVDGQQGRGMVFIKKKQEVVVDEKNKIGRPPSIGTKLRKVAPERKIRAAERDFKNR